MERENFPQYYTILFNGIADALKALDQQETSRGLGYSSPHSAGG